MWAFIDCESLATVYYAGSREEWEARLTDEYGGSVTLHPTFENVSVYYNYTRVLKITAQPTDQNIKLGDTVKLNVKAEGEGLTYQWYFKKAGQTSFSKWNGRTHATETVTPNATWNGIQLYCEIRDAAGAKVRPDFLTCCILWARSMEKLSMRREGREKLTFSSLKSWSRSSTSCPRQE